MRPQSRIGWSARSLVRAVEGKKLSQINTDNIASIDKAKKRVTIHASNIAYVDASHDHSIQSYRTRTTLSPSVHT